MTVTNDRRWKPRKYSTKNWWQPTELSAHKLWIRAEFGFSVRAQSRRQKSTFRIFPVGIKLGISLGWEHQWTTKTARWGILDKTREDNYKTQDVTGPTICTDYKKMFFYDLDLIISLPHEWEALNIKFPTHIVNWYFWKNTIQLTKLKFWKF